MGINFFDGSELRRRRIPHQAMRHFKLAGLASDEGAIFSNLPNMLSPPVPQISFPFHSKSETLPTE
jgi:hypothetical protein